MLAATLNLVYLRIQAVGFEFDSIVHSTRAVIGALGAYICRYVCCENPSKPKLND